MKCTIRKCTNWHQEGIQATRSSPLIIQILSWHWFTLHCSPIALVPVIPAWFNFWQPHSYRCIRMTNLWNTVTHYSPFSLFIQSIPPLNPMPSRNSPNTKSFSHDITFSKFSNGWFILFLLISEPSEHMCPVSVRTSHSLTAPPSLNRLLLHPT